MKPIDDLDDTLDRAVERHIFGTKMRSNILELNKQVSKMLLNNNLNSLKNHC